MTAPTIRLADFNDDADLEAVIELTAEFKAIGDERLSWPQRAGLAHQLRHHAAFGLLAFKGPTAVGMLVAQANISSFSGLPSCNIHDLYLVADARGAGLGRLMMASGADHARAMGFGRLTLEVGADNLRALDLYRGLGFDVPEATAAGEASEGATYFVTCPLD